MSRSDTVSGSSSRRSTLATFDSRSFMSTTSFVPYLLDNSEWTPKRQTSGTITRYCCVQGRNYKVNVLTSEERNLPRSSNGQVLPKIALKAILVAPANELATTDLSKR
uniref:Uncharacterized protein n=1 Tax=Steinernema glaseri TaxID=37863 RepID=A0A1I7YJ87_9BILA